MFFKFVKKPTRSQTKSDWSICSECSSSNVEENMNLGERTCCDCGTVLETGLIDSTSMPRSFKDDFGVSSGNTGYGPFHLVESFGPKTTTNMHLKQSIEVPSLPSEQEQPKQHTDFDQNAPSLPSSSQGSSSSSKFLKTNLYDILSKVRGACESLKLTDNTINYAVLVAEELVPSCVHLIKGKGKTEAFIGAVILIACEQTGNSRTVRNISSVVRLDISEVSGMKKKLIQKFSTIQSAASNTQKTYMAVEIMNMFDWCHEAAALKLNIMVDEIKNRPDIQCGSRTGQSIMSVLLYWGDVIHNTQRQVTQKEYLEKTGYCSRTFNRVTAELEPHMAYITEKCFGRAIHRSELN